MAITKSPFPALPDNPSKAQEIEHLRAFSASLPEQSYLASFLNETAIDWFAQRVHDDNSCDLLAELTYERQQRAADAEAAMQTRRADVAAVKAELKQAREETATVKLETARTIKDLEIRRDELIGVRDDLAKRFADEQAAYASLSAAYNEDLERCATTRDELADAQITIRDLKAKLFDLLIAFGKVAL